MYDSKYSDACDLEKVTSLRDACVAADYPLPVAESIAKVASAISFSKRLKRGVPSDFDEVELEAYHSVSDADMLEAMGSTGVVRTFVYQACMGNGSAKDALQHVQNKLTLCDSYMWYAASQKESKRRLATMLLICHELQREQSSKRPLCDAHLDSRTRARGGVDDGHRLLTREAGNPVDGADLAP